MVNKKTAVIGDPIDHSLSPKIHNHWIESEKMEVASSALLQELKTFIARGSSFAAKDGETDDLVMEAVLIVRMALEVTKYEDKAFLDLKGQPQDEEYEEPMPFSIL